jgi:hypothetical protein
MYAQVTHSEPTEDATVQRRLRRDHHQLLPELQGSGSGALEVKLKCAKQSRGNWHPHLGFDGCGGKAACSRGGELLVFKLDDSVGGALVVLQLYLLFPWQWRSSWILLRW